jgi:hypothetical protein
MIDHFVLGAADLDRAMQFVADAIGVEPAPGGRHPKLGTHNALVSLGERQYLEILAPDPTRDVLVDALAMLPCLAAPRLVKWAVATNDVAQAQELLQTHGFPRHSIESGSRTRADGSEVSWRQVGFLGAQSLEVPFVIEWAAGSTHPATGAPGGCSIARFTVRSESHAALRRLCADLNAAVEVARATVPRLELVLDTPRGEVKLTS